MAVDRSDREAPKRKAKSPVVRVPTRIDAGPMYVNPSVDELDQIEAVLMDDTFASPRDMAREVHKLVVKQARDREWFSVYAGDRHNLKLVGMENTESRANAWADKNLHPNAWRMVVPIAGPGHLAKLELEREQLTEDSHDSIAADEERLRFEQGGLCPECGHSGASHVYPMTGRIEPGKQNGPGRCLGPGKVPGPEVHPNIGKSWRLCGCKAAVKRKEDE